MESKIKIVIADDHGLMRQGIALMLENITDVEVVGEVESGEEAINLTSKFFPDVFLMDILMKGITGIEAARWIKDLSPNTKIILISSEITKEFVATGIAAGIDGYLLKSTDTATLLVAIRTVAKGEKYFSNEVTTHIINNLYANKRQRKSVFRMSDNILTKRELEVLKLLSIGKSHKEISTELFISVKTVETHKLNIKGKLNLTNTAQLVRYAIENNLVGISK
jgi:DNA-binding NarL/FixJ family response regulator